MADDESRILSVSAVNTMARTVIEGTPALSSLRVRGEISNLRYTGGHMYFSLKDGGAAIPAVMFRASCARLKIVPADGMKVIAVCSATVYVPTGRFQLSVTDMRPDGVGSLYLQYELLRKKLEAEGLFDRDTKKPVPKIPSVVGVITSPTGAAVRDIINVCGRRFPFAKVVVFPSLVQGSGAEENLMEGVRWFGSGRADVIIIGRGGGSIEDLWCFNSEALAREIRKSSVPVISAVGHETDFTICDFAADMRAPTPSAAAEIAVPDTFELVKKFDNVMSILRTRLYALIDIKRRELSSLERSPMLKNPHRYIEDRRMEVVEARSELERAVTLYLSAKRERLGRRAELLNAVSPLRLVSKGYTMVTDSGGESVKSVKNLKKGDIIGLTLVDGKIKAGVTEVTENGQ